MDAAATLAVLLDVEGDDVGIDINKGCLHSIMLYYDTDEGGEEEEDATTKRQHPEEEEAASYYNSPRGHRRRRRRMTRLERARVPFFFTNNANAIMQPADWTGRCCPCVVPVAVIGLAK
mmetsp:Transcript_42659/g.102887  ORF Transcript_42659/g.102887 Transcript_42659/m.102887 type:complete len:119 (-) Transcript_42659:87-443(-)